MKKIISSLVLVWILVTSCSKSEEVVIDNSVKSKYVKTQTLVQKLFAENIKLIWKVSSSQETSISPLTSWVIKTLNVKIWDKVKKGDILATIDTKSNLISNNLNVATNAYDNTVNVYQLTKESVSKDLESAKVQLENAKSTRDNTYASTDEQLKIVQTQLNNIQTQVKNTKQSSNSSLDLAQKSLENAKLNLDNFEKNYTETMQMLDTKKSNLVTNINSTISSSLVSIDSALTYADTILWVTNWNKNLNDSYEIYLSAKNTTYKNNAEYDFVKAKSLYDSVYSSNKSDIEKLDNLYELVNNTVSLYENLVKVWENSIVSSSLPDTSTSWISLTWIKTNVKTYQASVLWVKSAVITLQNSWNDLMSTISSTKTSLETNRSSLNQAVIIAETSLDNTKNSINTNIDSLNWNETLTKNQLESTLASIKQSRDSVDNALKIAENNYNSTKAKLDSSLAWVKTQLDSATWQKNSLLEQLDNSLIKAPFDWVITSRNIEVWTMVSAQSQTFILSKQTNKIIKLDVSSDNIKYLSLAKEVNIEKNWKTSTWVISVLWASADNITKMFKVEITFNNKDFNDWVVLWDFVDIFIQKDIWTQKFIVVPFSALVVWSNDSYSVYTVWKDNLVSEKKVTVWDSNSNEVIITSGLIEWEKVITEWWLKVSPWDKVEEM